MPTAHMRDLEMRANDVFSIYRELCVDAPVGVPLRVAATGTLRVVCPRLTSGRWTTTRLPLLG